MSTVKVVHIKLYFWMINQFHKESDDCCCQKLSLKDPNLGHFEDFSLHLLTKYNTLLRVQFVRKSHNIWHPKVENLITRLTIIFMHMCILLLMFLLQKRYKLHTHTDRSFHIYIKWRMCSITNLNRHKWQLYWRKVLSEISINFRVPNFSRNI
jgi:hypothetical protein